uniref:Uncharacterized protein n=1 Tax=Arundo donax TaxID=35708 RepID=A0A0A9FLK3_ARUDO
MELEFTTIFKYLYHLNLIIFSHVSIARPLSILFLATLARGSSPALRCAKFCS